MSKISRSLSLGVFRKNILPHWKENGLNLWVFVNGVHITECKYYNSINTGICDKPREDKNDITSDCGRKLS